MSTYLISKEAWNLLDNKEFKLEALNKAFNINIHIPAIIEARTYDGIVILPTQLNYVEELINKDKLDEKEVIILHPMLECMSDAWWKSNNILRMGCIQSI
jgi:hypothetical protein